MKISQEAKHAFYLGLLCSISYLAVYVVKNTLSAVSPQLLEDGVFSTEYIGRASSLYFISYAIGQLFNGILGDRIKARYMISFGLGLAGVTTLIFSRLSALPELALVVYALTGLFLSMIYAPMTKVVSENTNLLYATRCNMGYNFASFLGSPTAGMLAAVLSWQSVFTVSGVVAVIMAVCCFAFFLYFEKKGIVSYNKYPRQARAKGSIKVLLERQIVKFTIISLLTGIIRTSVVFWLPTYLSQYLGFSPQISATIYTVITLALSANTFLVIFVYERLRHNMDLTILLMFSLSSVCFLLVFLLKAPVWNIILLVLAIMSSNGAATMLWSRYCPSLRDTGMVSTATGFLDFVSYMAASISSTLFANAVSTIGWGNLILVWMGLVLIGVIISLPFKKRSKKQTS